MAMGAIPSRHLSARRTPPALSRCLIAGFDGVITVGSGDQIVAENMLLSRLTQDGLTFSSR